MTNKPSMSLEEAQAALATAEKELAAAEEFEWSVKSNEGPPNPILLQKATERLARAETAVFDAQDHLKKLVASAEAENKTSFGKIFSRMGSSGNPPVPPLPPQKGNFFFGREFRGIPVVLLAIIFAIALLFLGWLVLLGLMKGIDTKAQAAYAKAEGVSEEIEVVVKDVKALSGAVELNAKKTVALSNQVTEIGETANAAKALLEQCNCGKPSQTQPQTQPPAVKPPPKPPKAPKKKQTDDTPKQISPAAAPAIQAPAPPPVAPPPNLQAPQKETCGKEEGCIGGTNKVETLKTVPRTDGACTILAIRKSNRQESFRFEIKGNEKSGKLMIARINLKREGDGNTLTRFEEGKALILDVIAAKGKHPETGEAADCYGRQAQVKAVWDKILPAFGIPLDCVIETALLNSKKQATQPAA